MGVAGLDGRTGASPDIHSLFPPLPRDGWQAARELRSSARPSVRHHCASLLAAVRTRLAARTRPYGFLLHVCTVCTTRQGDRSIVPTQVQVSQHRMSRSNAGAGYEFRIFHRFILPGPKMVTFRDRLAAARCPRWCSLVATVPLRRLVSRQRLAFLVGDAGPGVKAAQWCVHQP